MRTLYGSPVEFFSSLSTHIKVEKTSRRLRQFHYAPPCPKASSVFSLSHSHSCIMKLPSTAFLLSLPATVYGAVGGRCSSFWGQTGCICLDKTVCERTWHGVSIEGWAGSWPCPNDPVNVMGCQVSPCAGSANSCQWRDQCIIPVAGERKFISNTRFITLVLLTYTEHSRCLSRRQRLHLLRTLR